MIARIERHENGSLWADCVPLELADELRVLVCGVDGGARWVDAIVSPDTETGKQWLEGVLDAPEGLFCDVRFNEEPEGVPVFTKDILTGK